MVPFFVQIKCHLGKSYEVANKLADAEIASEIYSTAGDFDLLVKFYVEDGTDIGHFVNEQVAHTLGIVIDGAIVAALITRNPGAADAADRACRAILTTAGPNGPQ